MDSNKLGIKQYSPLKLISNSIKTVGRISSYVLDKIALV